MLRTELIESDLTFAYIIGHFRLNEMLLHVDAHKEGAEITYLVVILHLIDSYILNFQFRHHEHGRVESRLDTDIYFFCIGAVHFFCVIVLADSRAGYS